MVTSTTEPKSPRVKALEGLGLAATFLGFAMFCVFAPEYFDATGWQASAWFYAGAAAAFIAVVGASSEIGRLTAKEAATDLGMGFGLLWLAAVIGITGWNHDSGLLKWAAVPVGFFGLYGLSTGTVKAAASPPRRIPDQKDTGDRAGRAIGLLLGILGLCTAAANLVAAVAKAG